MTDWIKLRETKLQAGITLEDYRDFVERKAYYVDKTWFIREFLRVTTRPYSSLSAFMRLL